MAQTTPDMSFGPDRQPNESMLFWLVGIKFEMIRLKGK